jgi:Fur family ferric uptake transcriptional regulator/Fur family zinc uptake transcriptional regulator
MTVEELLSKAKLRATHQRKVVLSLLIEKASPLSHSEISSMLTEPLDKVTLYRTLQTLKTYGIVHQVQGLDGVWRFCAHDPGRRGAPGTIRTFFAFTAEK